MSNKLGFGIILGAALLVLTTVVMVVFGPLAPGYGATDEDDEARGAPAGGHETAATAKAADPLAIPRNVRGFSAVLESLGDAIGDNYWYMPYAVANERQGIAMVNALKPIVEEGGVFPDKLDVATGAGAGGSGHLYRVREGVTQQFITDVNNPAATAVAQSDVPIIITQPEPGARSADVLFMDGHVESVAVGDFPLSPGFLDKLSELDPPEHAEG